VESTPSRRNKLREHVEAKPPSLWRALWVIILVTLVFVVVGAIAMRLVEPDVFTNIGDALWFSVVTVSTVGYGDIVPESTIGRFVASVIMIFGLAFVPAVTAVVVSTMMGRRTAERSTLVGRDQPNAADPERQNGDET
jgi:voltage-gated potassium channel Kch